MTTTNGHGEKVPPKFDGGDKVRSVRLTVAQWVALGLLATQERNLGRPLEAGDAGTYTSTWADTFTTGVHWRTAQALARRGLVTIDADGCAYDEPADVYLTDAGRALIGRSE